MALGEGAEELSCPIEVLEVQLPPSPDKPEDEHLEEVEHWSALAVHWSGRCEVIEDGP